MAGAAVPDHTGEVNYTEAGQRVSRVAGFMALAAWHLAYGIVWWAWFIWIPLIGIGAFFVPYAYVAIAALAGAPLQALRERESEPPD